MRRSSYGQKSFASQDVKSTGHLFWLMNDLPSTYNLEIYTCIFASSPFCPACSIFSDPAMSTSISRPPTVGTSRIICKIAKEVNFLPKDRKLKNSSVLLKDLMKLFNNRYHAVTSRTSLVTQCTFNYSSLLHLFDLFQYLSCFISRYKTCIFCLLSHYFQFHLKKLQI